jgi:pimeloyl-ACP methyl ester carboxylesterase
MRWWLLLGVFVLAAGVSAAVLAFSARTTKPVRLGLRGAPHACGHGLRCAVVVVPLDYAGGSTRTVALHVTELPGVPGTPPVFLLAGGPGQLSSEIFRLGRKGVSPDGRTFVVFDPRGTTGKGALRCATTRPDGTCELEPRPDLAFYSTRDNARDIDAVRTALGMPKITLFGTSYGTKVALTYARLFPRNVESMVLDSPTPIGIAAGSASLAAEPRALDSICAVRAAAPERAAFGCTALLRAPSADLVRLANRLARDGSVATALALLRAVRDSDYNEGIAAEVPGAIEAGLRGDLAPLRRLVSLRVRWRASDPFGINRALQRTTSCDDRANEREHPDSTSAAPFGPWAQGMAAVDSCAGWPPPEGGTLPARYPDVPVLVLSGDRDVRTPTAWARQVAAAFPRHWLLLAAGIGHAVEGSSPCASVFAASWLGQPPTALKRRSGRTAASKRPSICPRQYLNVVPVGPFTDDLRHLPPLFAATPLPRRLRLTFRAAAQTYREAFAASLFAVPGTPVGGLVSGTLRLARNRQSFRLDRYSDYRGIALTGTIRLYPQRATLVDRDGNGRFAITGARAEHGTLSTSENGLVVRFGKRSGSAA